MRKHHKITLCLLAALSVVPFFVQADRAEPQRMSGVEPLLAARVEAAPLALVAALPAREGMAELRVDPFSRARQDQRLSARRLTAPAAPALVAPPNPYRFAGEVRQRGVTRRFLVRGNDIFEVSPGEVLSDGYRVETVTETEVVLVHIATGVRHVLAQKTT